jgi:hypothetical protein
MCGTAHNASDSGAGGVVTYEKKFGDFMKMCDDAQKERVSVVIVSHPAVLGDSYEEIIESLSRLAEANLSLRIVGRERAE